MRYLQRAGKLGWVHYCSDGETHVTTKDWVLWFKALMRRKA